MGEESRICRKALDNEEARRKGWEVAPDGGDWRATGGASISKGGLADEPPCGVIKGLGRWSPWGLLPVPPWYPAR